MDYDDFKKIDEQLKRQRFDKFRESFDNAMREKGDPRTFDDLLGTRKGPAEQGPSAERRQLEELVHELLAETTDESPQDLILRGLSVYRSIVRHARAGGTVKFVGTDGSEKTLKVRLRPKET